jgi:hypothetical protein
MVPKVAAPRELIGGNADEGYRKVADAYRARSVGEHPAESSAPTPPIRSGLAR